MKSKYKKGLFIRLTNERKKENECSMNTTHTVEFRKKHQTISKATTLLIINTRAQLLWEVAINTGILLPRLIRRKLNDSPP